MFTKAWSYPEPDESDPGPNNSFIYSQSHPWLDILHSVLSTHVLHAFPIILMHATFPLISFSLRPTKYETPHYAKITKFSTTDQ